MYGCSFVPGLSSSPANKVPKLLVLELTYISLILGPKLVPAVDNFPSHVNCSKLATVPTVKYACPFFAVAVNNLVSSSVPAPAPPLSLLVHLKANPSPL